jgi:hypothetical protein
MKRYVLSVLAMLVVCLSAPLQADAQQDRPNIVLLLAVLRF